MRIHKLLGSFPQIVPLEALMTHPSRKFVNLTRIEVLYPYYQEDLFSFLATASLDSIRANRWQIMDDLLKAMALFKTYDIFHSDLKPENILIEIKEDAQVCAKITDFGASSCQHQGSNVNDFDSIPRSTLIFLSPEAIQSYVMRDYTNIHSEKNDIWALGLIAYRLLDPSNPPTLPVITYCNRVQILERLIQLKQLSDFEKTFQIAPIIRQSDPYFF